MCLIASYTEIEKLNQVKKVRHLLTLPVDTEEAKKNLLYNVSFMNNMVIKGYMKERTDMDSLIYETKDKALNLFIHVMPDRCHQEGTCLYVYAAGRQYSYHFMVNDFTGHNKALYDFEWNYCHQHGLSPFGKFRRKGTEWDNIREGFALSDEEYKTRYNEHKEFVRNAKQRKDEATANYEKELERKARIYMLRGIKEARMRNKEIRKHNAHFWNVIESGLTNAQKRTKAYQNKDGYKLRKLYGEKLGLKWGDEPTPLETLPVCTFGEGKWCYTLSWEESCIYDRMLQIYRELRKKGFKKYII